MNGVGRKQFLGAKSVSFLKRFICNLFVSNRDFLLAFLLLSLSSIFLQSYIFNFLLPTKLLLPWLLYLSLLFILRPYHSAIFVFLLECLFLRIHFLKMAYTNTPFEASDIFGWRQALFVNGYTDYLVPMISVGLAICFFKGLTFKKQQLLFLPIMLLMTTSCIQERRSTDFGINPVSFLFRLARVTCVDWNFATNIKENGVLNHLFMTLPMGQVPPKGKAEYQKERLPTAVKNKEEPDVFLVLCESCYTSSTENFVTPMINLEQHGYKRTSIISPVYGGMTAEAEFEILTGLPSQRYKGVDFQYFAESFSENAVALPKVLVEHGYHSFSAHNNKGFFWRRNIIHPKFGFQKSYFLEDMDWRGDDLVPEDDILFQKTLGVYKENLESGKKTFAFLITLHTHGPYKEHNGDGGEADYKAKLEKSIDQFVRFQSKVIEIAQKRRKPVLFLIFGDHKPAMTISFYKRHVFNDDFFEAKGERNDSFQFSDLNDSQRLIYGRVPLFIKAVGLTERDFVRDFSMRINDKPIYCLPGVLASKLAVENQFYEYLNEVCGNSSARLVDRGFITETFKEEVYGNLLFN